MKSSKISSEWPREKWLGSAEDIAQEGITWLCLPTNEQGLEAENFSL